MATVEICHLYPRELNIYADRGNLAVFAHRLAARGHRLRIVEVEPGDQLPTGAHLYYLGGGQDRDQLMVADDLRGTKGQRLREVVDGGAVMLAVCGGFQLAGHGYTAVDGTRMDGVGVLDADTIGGPTRLISNIAIEAELEGERGRIVGFENHAGRTTLGTGSVPLGRVITGFGNDGTSGFEGAVTRRAIGTYLHGPLLPKNPWLADRLLEWALEAAGTPVSLDPLDDALEIAAQRAALRRMGLTA
ncbi:MAG: glutamine amidotransferase [Thermoleophilia bacterium]